MSERAELSKCDNAFLKLANFMQHPLTIGAETVICGLNAYAILKGHTNSNAEDAYGLFSAELSALGLGYLTYEGTKAAAKKFREPDQIQLCSRQPNFTDYVDDDGCRSPFLVAVTGIRQELLGLGKVIGGLNEDTGTTPIIALPDHHSPHGIVELRGDECWWIQADEEIIDMSVYQMTNGLTTPPYDYQKSLYS